MKSTLIIGGARSGKSSYAQALALKSEKPVLFVATAEAGDEEMKQRIEKHRKARPATWQTLEATNHLGRRIALNVGKVQTVIVDCITLLVNNIFQLYTRPDDEEIDAVLVEKEVMAEIDELVYCITQSDASFIIVTNEVGLGLVPADRVSRLYRDLLGKVNQKLAQNTDEVILMTAGIPVKIKPYDDFHPLKII